MSPPQKARQNIEEQILVYAKGQARDGETAERALAQLMDDRDRQVESMYAATSIMKGIDVPSNSRKQAEAIMQRMAKSEAARTGATEHEAASALLRDDADYRKTYAFYVGLI